MPKQIDTMVFTTTVSIHFQHRKYVKVNNLQNIDILSKMAPNESHFSPLPLVSITSSKMLLLSTQFLVKGELHVQLPGSNDSTG